MLITTDDTVFELLETESLLEGLERTGHTVEYQCRSGYCGSCRIKLISGRVHYNERPLAFIGQDEILPCCCSVTEDITVGVALDESHANRQSDLFMPDLFDEKSTAE